MTEEGFLEALQTSLGDEAFELALRAGLAERLAAGLIEARRRWPESPVANEEFAGYVAVRLSHAASLHEAARRLRIEELFLAWWAGSGDRLGIVAFESEFAADLGRLMARFVERPEEEQRERLRIKLFFGSGSTMPRIRDYSGQEALQAWLRVTASRALVDATRGEP